MVFCNECKKSISEAEADYSLENFNNFLCMACQKKITPEEKKLFDELISRDVECVLHKNDGYKTIDLVLPEYMLNIEVDGAQHNFDAKQAFSDLARSRHSRQKGWETIRFPNSVIRNDVKKVAKEIEEIVEDLEEDEF